MSSTPGWTLRIDGTESTVDEGRAEKGKRWASAESPERASERASASAAAALRRCHQTPSHVVRGKCVTSQREQRCGLPL